MSLCHFEKETCCAFFDAFRVLPDECDILPEISLFDSSPTVQRIDAVAQPLKRAFAGSGIYGIYSDSRVLFLSTRDGCTVLTCSAGKPYLQCSTA